MSGITITSPTSGTPNPIKNGGFVASGLARKGIIGVVGTCTKEPGHAHPIRGTLLDFRLMTAGKHKGSHLWVIGFQLDPAAYELKVVGFSEEGPVATATVEIGAQTQPTKGPHLLSITISDPPPGTDITDLLCSGLFLPGGLVNDGSVVAEDKTKLFLANDPSTSINALFTLPFDIFWFAQFPQVTEPLDPGPGDQEPEALTLHLEDTDGNPSEVTPLYASLPCGS
jgi:hypothetical protein